VDKKEVNPICPGYDWYVPDIAQAKLTGFNEKNNSAEGIHSDFPHLKKGEVYRRRLCLSQEGALTITDKVPGRGKHLLEWRFVVAPGLSIKADTKSCLVRIYKNSVPCAKLSYSDNLGLLVRQEKTNYAFEYGRWAPVNVIVIFAKQVLPAKAKFTITPE
jgi:hypothetical protein